MPIDDDGFIAGDDVIRQRLGELARRNGFAPATVERRLEKSGSYTYKLQETGRSIALRAKDIRDASEPPLMKERIEPRLDAMFEDLWWRRAVVLMKAGKDAKSLRRS